MRLSRSPSISWAMLLVTSALVLSGCSLDILPVHYSRVKSAQKAKEPIQRGPHAPGAFKKNWTFRNEGGYLHDPSKIDVVEGLARLKLDKPGALPTLEKSAILETSTSALFEALDGFAESTGPAHKGVIKYQLSNDGTHWFHHNGIKWIPAARSHQQANTAAEVNAHVTAFNVEVGTGRAFVRAFLISPTGREPVELQQIQLLGVAPPSDGWN